MFALAEKDTGESRVKVKTLIKLLSLLFASFVFVVCLWQMEVCLNAIDQGWALEWNVMFTWITVNAWAARDFFMSILALDFVLVFLVGYSFRREKND